MQVLNTPKYEYRVKGAAEHLPDGNVNLSLNARPTRAYITKLSHAITSPEYWQEQGALGLERTFTIRKIHEQLAHQLSQHWQGHLLPERLLWLL